MYTNVVPNKKNKFMAAEKESGVFNVTITLPETLREVYTNLKKSKRLALSSFTVNNMCKEFPEVRAALAEKGGN
jgi:hypothetical protein